MLEYTIKITTSQDEVDVVLHTTSDEQLYYDMCSFYLDYYFPSIRKSITGEKQMVIYLVKGWF